jgi:uncharacterized protein
MLILILASRGALAQGPSFDCDKATAEMEELICGDAGLSSLDRKLASVYAEALEKQEHPAPARFGAEQRGWIKRRNECWKSSDQKGCVQAEYAGRIAELQAKSRLVPSRGPFTFRCTRADGGRDQVIATFYQTEPPTAILERGDTNILAFLSRSGSGAKYNGPNVMFWDKGPEAQVTWMGVELKCTSH